MARSRAVDQFKRLSSPALLDMLTDGAVDVLSERGVDGFSIGEVARRVDLSPQSVSNKFPAAEGGRARVLQLITTTFADRWLGWVLPGHVAAPPYVVLPETDEERRGVRVWLAFQELARGELTHGRPDPTAAVRGATTEERQSLRASLSRWRGSPVDSATALPLTLLIDGLRMELAAHDPAVDLATARSVLHRHVEDLGPGSTGTSRAVALEQPTAPNAESVATTLSSRTPPCQ